MESCRFRRALEASGDGWWEWELGEDRLEVGRRWLELAGLDSAPVTISSDLWLDRVHPEDRHALKRAISDHLTGQSGRLRFEHRLRGPAGEYRWRLVRARAERSEEGRPLRLSGTVTDIDERKRSEERLLHDALHDALTGLPNATLLSDRIEVALAQERRSRDVRFAVLYLDLDRFKAVNDNLGHAIGDELLVSVALRLQTVVRPGDTVSRLGGDEFAILAAQVASEDDAVRIADRVLEALAEPFLVDGHELSTGASVGIALAESTRTGAEELLHRADSAMYRAKARGRGCAVTYDRRMEREASRRLDREEELSHAFDEGHLKLRYLPVVDLESGSLAGYEALLRWDHPHRGELLPGEFIALAERSGLIVPIGRRVLRDACAQMAAWASHPDVPRDLAICVNLSVRQFWQPGLVAEIERALAVTGLDAGRLRLDITENALMRHPAASVDRLERLRAIGVRVQVDDFGTGLSSLAQLHRLPADLVKIDRSFVSSGAEADLEPRAIEGIVSLARAFDIGVAVEGLETAEQLDRMRRLDCREAQGYFFSRPLDAGEAGELAAGARRW